MKKKTLIEKLIKVCTIEKEEDMISTILLTYKNNEDETGAIDMSLPRLNAVINRRIYLKSDLESIFCKNLEEEVIIRLLEASEKWTGSKEQIFILYSNCDQEMYGVTFRVRANVVICNKKNKKFAKKTSGRKVYVSEYMPEDTLLLMYVPTATDDVSYSAVLVKDKEEKNYLLDIVNPDLIKSIRIEG